MTWTGYVDLAFAGNDSWNVCCDSQTINRKHEFKPRSPFTQQLASTHDPSVWILLAWLMLAMFTQTLKNFTSAKHPSILTNNQMLMANCTLWAIRKVSFFSTHYFCFFFFFLQFMAQKQLMCLFYPETHLYDNGSAGFYPAEHKHDQANLVLDLKKPKTWHRLSPIFKDVKYTSWYITQSWFP